jgi:electron transfer flavoprotein-quinone oxidoreductase
MKKYDLIVVGGGPGGAVAGKTAAEAGLKTLIIERGTRPGEKNVSGTGLSPKCFRDFDFIRAMKLPHERKATSASLHLSDERDLELVGFTFSASQNASYEQARDFLTVNVYRSELDPYLAELAVRAGAELILSTKVVELEKNASGRITGVRTDKNEVIAADIVIGADGVISTVARCAGIRERWQPNEVAMIINVDFGAKAENIDRVIAGNALHYWYSAVFPVGYSFFTAEGFHIGLGCYMDWWQKNPHYYLRKMFALEGVQKQIALCDGQAREFQNHLVTFLTAPARTYSDSVMLVGDAAGFACPFEAEGVYYAMVSGELAAEVAVKAIGRGDVSAEALSEYETRWKQSTVGEEFVAGASIEGFVRELGFNPEAGKWVVPFLNDILYGLCNVAESHTNNVRNFGDLLLGYMPDLARTVRKDLLPLAAAIQAPPAKPPSKLVSRMLQTVLPRILPLIARSAANSDGRYSPIINPLLMDHLVDPLIQARLQKRKGAKHD